MMLDIFGHADRLGSEKIVHILKPALGLKAIVVIDNCAAGPAMGGVRMASDVNLDECARLARAMTLKNAAAGLPHGGAKSVVVGDPRMPMANKERLIRAFATSICELKDYIPGPDMGTDEEAMAWIKNEIGRAVGLPRILGGIPLDEIGATGSGLAIAAQVVEEFGGPRLEGARVAVQGFGAVGQHVARFLAEKGAPLIAACDSRATVVDPEGLDVGRLIEFKRQGKSFTDYDKGKKLAPEDIIDIACDIWIPAARPDVINSANVERLNAKLVLQGANIPVTLDAERRLHERGILSIPDFVANAGGVICASVEYHGGTEKAAFDVIAAKILVNTREVLRAAKEGNKLPRQAATAMAERRVETAMALRRWR